MIVVNLNVDNRPTWRRLRDDLWELRVKFLTLRLSLVERAWILNAIPAIISDQEMLMADIGLAQYEAIVATARVLREMLTDLNLPTALNTP